MGELQRVNGAHWDVEMGAITHMLTETSRGHAPAILFDEVPGYPKGYRTLYGQLSSIRRIALTLGLPLEHDRKVDIVQRYHERMRELQAAAAARRQGRRRSSRTSSKATPSTCSNSRCRDITSSIPRASSAPPTAS